MAQLGETIYVPWITPGLNTGAAKDADGDPALALLQNGEVAELETVLTNPVTGSYVAEVTFAADDWAAGDSFAVIATWSMDGTAGIKQVIAAGVVEGSLAAAVGARPVSELSAGPPPAEPTADEALALLYMALRNGGPTTAVSTAIENDDGEAICEAPVSFDGVTFRRGKYE